MNTFNRVTFDAARLELSAFVLDSAFDTALRLGIGWFATPDAPSSRIELQLDWERVTSEPSWAIRNLRVLDGYCENTIYGAPETNHAFRFWHDVCHIETGLGFSDADEFQVALDHQHAAVLAGVGRLARLILWADTVGQTEFYNRTGTFPTNQLVFVERYVTAHLANGRPIEACVEAHNREVANDPAARDARRLERLAELLELGYSATEAAASL